LWARGRGEGKCESKPGPMLRRAVSGACRLQARGIASSGGALGSLSANYAAALFNEAKNAKVAAEVESDVTSLKRLLEMTPSLTSFLKDPSTPAATKMGILREAAGKLGTSKAVLNLLEVLGEGGRLGHVPDICDEFMRMASGTRGESMAVVTTFEPLSAAQGKQVGVLLGKILGTAQPLEVVAKVDPSIMGGMIVEVGDKYIDLSTRTKLRSIEQAISSA